MVRFESIAGIGCCILYVDVYRKGSFNRLGTVSRPLLFNNYFATSLDIYKKPMQSPRQVHRTARAT